MVMSHTGMLMMGLLMVWAWRRWRERRALRFDLMLGRFSGLAASEAAGCLCMRGRLAG